MRFVPNAKEIAKKALSMWLAYSGVIIGVLITFQSYLEVGAPLAHALGVGQKMGVIIIGVSTLAGLLRLISQDLTKKEEK